MVVRLTNTVLFHEDDSFIPCFPLWFRPSPFSDGHAQICSSQRSCCEKPCLLDNKGSVKRYCCEICAGWSAFNFTIGDGLVEQPLAWILHKVVCCDEENVIERVLSSTCGGGTPGRKVCVTRMNLFNAVYYWTLSLGSLSAQGLVQPQVILGLVRVVIVVLSHCKG